MVNPTYPGVYVREVSSGVRPIAAASTSTAAFVGLTEMGPDNEAVRVTSWTEYQRRFGSFIDDGYLAESVFNFFNNGGSQCYIVRVTRSDAASAFIVLNNREGFGRGIRIEANSTGAWGNYLYVTIEDGSVDPGNTFKITLRRQEAVDTVPENFLSIPPLEEHDNLSMNPDAPNFVETIIARDSNLIAVAIPPPNTSTQRGRHTGGFQPDPPTLPLNDNRSFQINLDGDGYQQVTLPDTIAGSTDLAAIATEIQTAVTALTPQRSSTPAAAFTGFTAEAETVDGQSRLLLQSGTNAVNSSVRIQPASSNNATVQLLIGPNGGVSSDGHAVRRPAIVAAAQLGDNAVEGVVFDVQEGTDGEAELDETSYSSQFSLLDNVTDFSLLAVPGVGTTVMVSLGMEYCANRPLQDVFFIGDMDQYDDEPAEAETFRNGITSPNSYGAVYFPWVLSLDPSGRASGPVALPPSGYMAGLYARIDGSRNVAKAPAGTEATISGAVGLTIRLTDVQQGNLNRIGVNCIRRFDSAGIVSWGARTVTSNPEYGYVPVRRTAIMLRVSIYNGIQWAVFEPNDEDLWAQLRLNIGTFMMNQYRRGLFQGSSPSDAFFVKCDSETTTQGDIDLGIVNVVVGFAPLKPAEFVIVSISQKAGQAS